MPNPPGHFFFCSFTSLGIVLFPTAQPANAPVIHKPFERVTTPALRTPLFLKLVLHSSGIHLNVIPCGHTSDSPVCGSIGIAHTTGSSLHGSPPFVNGAFTCNNGFTPRSLP